MIVTPDTTIKNAILNALLTELNTGTGNATLEFYTGTMIATPSTAITTQTKLGTLVLSDPVGTVAGGELTLGAITSDPSADATGTATWALLKDADALGRLLFDVTNTGGNGAIKLNTVNIVAGGPISISSAVIRV